MRTALENRQIAEMAPFKKFFEQINKKADTGWTFLNLFHSYIIRDKDRNKLLKVRIKCDFPHFTLKSENVDLFRSLGYKVESLPAFEEGEFKEYYFDIVCENDKYYLAKAGLLSKDSVVYRISW